MNAAAETMGGATQLLFGANVIDGTGAIGRNIGQVRQMFGQVLNLADGSQSRVNGQPASDSHVVAKGEKVEFIKEAGRNG